MKKFKLLCAVISITILSTMPVYAGWEQTGTTWKYQNAGTYYNDGWHWIDGNGDNIAECYYFNADNTMLSNTTTPDNFTVNESGAWTVNGVVQTKVLNGSTSSSGNKEGTEVPQTEAPTQPQTGNSQSSGGYGNASEYWEGIPGYTGPSMDEILADPNTTAGAGGGGHETWN